MFCNEKKQEDSQQVLSICGNSFQTAGNAPADDLMRWFECVKTSFILERRITSQSEIKIAEENFLKICIQILFPVSRDPPAAWRSVTQQELKLRRKHASVRLHKSCLLTNNSL